MKVGTDGIPVDVVNKVTGERYCIQLSLAHNGEFGFTAVLSLDMDSKNAGRYASLYYYNVENSEAELICEDEISEDGTAEFIFTHASDYLIVIDEKTIKAEEGSESEKAAGIGMDKGENDIAGMSGRKSGGGDNDPAEEESIILPVTAVVLLIIALAMAIAWVLHRKHKGNMEIKG